MSEREYSTKQYLQRLKAVLNHVDDMESLMALEFIESLEKVLVDLSTTVIQRIVKEHALDATS